MDCSAQTVDPHGLYIRAGLDCMHNTVNPRIVPGRQSIDCMYDYSLHKAWAAGPQASGMQGRVTILTCRLLLQNTEVKS